MPPSRKSYSCVACRSRKVKCDRRRHCGNCRRKRVECIWAANGSPIREISPTVEVPDVFPPRVDLPQNSVLAEQLDHSILNATIESNRRKLDKPSLLAGYGDGMVTIAMTNSLPDRATADSLLRIYLERVEWIHHPLHIPSFLTQYNRFWTMGEVDRSRSVHARWLALLQVVLCLGMHFGDDDNEDLELQLLTACEESLAAADYLNEPTTEALQVIICLNLYLNNKNRAEAAKSLLGLAIKMAISMGLSRIPAETGGEGHLDREIGRRLWWSLVCQDAYTASASGFAYLVNMAHMTTGHFGNADDETMLPLPIEMPTASSYHLAKIGFAMVVRDFVDAINRNFPDPSYADILALEAQFRQVYESLPRFLRPDLAQPFALDRPYLTEQRVFMGVTLHNRIMRLHRGYMLLGYTDPTFARSTDVCLESAHALLGLVAQAKSLCRWWVVLVHVWTAGLIVAAAMTRDEGDRHRAAVADAIGLLEPASRSSPVAARGVRILRSIKVQDTTAPTLFDSLFTLDLGDLANFDAEFEWS